MQINPAVFRPLGIETIFKDFGSLILDTQKFYILFYCSQKKLEAEIYVCILGLFKHKARSN